MKYIGLLVFILYSCASTEMPERVDTEISIVTLNVHYLAVSNDFMKWDERKEAVTEVLKTFDADIMVFQEMETFERRQFSEKNIQLDWVMSQMPEYEAGAVGDPEVFPITQPILYRKDSYSLLEQGFFYFSSTPDIIYSWSWTNGFPYYATWVKLKHLDTERVFYVFNVHLDHSKSENRLKGTELILERMQGIEEPILLAGDFNSPPFYIEIQKIRRFGFSRVPIEGSTFHLNRGINIIPPIDHIFYSSELEQINYGIIRDKVLGVWPSDHYPLFAGFRFNN
jgi:endonuclease/exonuclease/phosphatase family metal-dependent hydrolase